MLRDVVSLFTFFLITPSLQLRIHSSNINVFCLNFTLVPVARSRHFGLLKHLYYMENMSISVTYRSTSSDSFAFLLQWGKMGVIYRANKLSSKQICVATILVGCREDSTRTNARNLTLNVLNKDCKISYQLYKYKALYTACIHKQ